MGEIFNERKATGNSGSAEPAKEGNSWKRGGPLVAQDVVFAVGTGREPPPMTSQPRPAMQAQAPLGLALTSPTALSGVPGMAVNPPPPACRPPPAAMPSPTMFPPMGMP